MLRSPMQRRVVTVWTADQQSKVGRAAIGMFADRFGKITARNRLAGLIEKDDRYPFRQFLQHPLRFVDLPLTGLPCPAFWQLKNLRPRQANRTSSLCETFPVPRGKLGFRSAFYLANGADDQPQSGLFAIGDGVPHFLQTVEITHFRSEDMDDDIASIDQHPVAGWNALDLGRTVALILQVA